MGSIYHPTDFGEDDMGNNWGTTLVDDVFDKRASGSKADLTGLIRICVPGFQLLLLTDSGTSANDRAIDLSTNGDHGTCLVAMGSYVAGSGVSQAFSTSKLMNNNVISLVSKPDESTVKAQSNTVAFPYHVPHGSFDDHVLQQLEEKCIHTLKIKIMTAIISGRPFQALLFEFILSGSGGVLSTRFLVALAMLLAPFKIVIIADEIMTGGRVGPQMTITTTLPRVVQDLVAYITMGKSMGCGMVLDRLSTESSDDRGTSTEMSAAKAYALLKAIYKRAQSGYIAAKRAIVLSAMKVNEGDDEVWPDTGGLLIFFSKARYSVLRGLKCRALPKLEISPKTRLHITGKMSEWNRVSINEHLMDRCNKWLAYSTLGCAENGSPYSYELSKFLVCIPHKTQIMHETLLAFIEKHGDESDEISLVLLHRARKIARFGNISGRCAKSHHNLVWESLKTAAQYSQGFVTPMKVNNKRKLCYLVDYDKLS